MNQDKLSITGHYCHTRLSGRFQQRKSYHWMLSIAQKKSGKFGQKVGNGLVQVKLWKHDVVCERFEPRSHFKSRMSLIVLRGIFGLSIRSNRTFIALLQIYSYFYFRFLSYGNVSTLPHPLPALNRFFKGCTQTSLFARGGGGGG